VGAWKSGKKNTEQGITTTTSTTVRRQYERKKAHPKKTLPCLTVLKAGDIRVLQHSPCHIYPASVPSLRQFGGGGLPESLAARVTCKKSKDSKSNRFVNRKSKGLEEMLIKIKSAKGRKRSWPTRWRVR
jgi:hypothetical protein